MNRVLEQPIIEPMDYADLDGFIECSLDSDANEYGFSTKRKKGGPVAVTAGREIPRYTRDLEAALMLLDDDSSAPFNSVGDDHREVLALCIEILAERWGIGGGTKKVTVDAPVGPYRLTAEDRERTGSRHRFVFRR